MIRQDIYEKVVKNNNIEGLDTTNVKYLLGNPDRRVRDIVWIYYIEPGRQCQGMLDIAHARSMNIWIESDTVHRVLLSVP